MRRLLARASAAVIGMTVGALQADTITYNDGTPPLECRVLEEGPDVVVVEINVTETIKDRKTIPRSVIKKIEKVPPDKVDYEILQKKVVPTPDMLTVEDYQKRIAMLKPFLAKYPTSEHAPQVQKLIALMGSEQAIVARGGVKLDGEWISPDERERRRYNIDADIIFRQMKSLSKSHKEYEAIKLFGTLEEEYPASVIFPEAVLLARELIPEIERDLMTRIVRQPSLVSERESGLRSLEANDQIYKKTKEAIDAEVREYEQTAEREKLARTKWITYYPYDLDSLEDALDVTRKEGNRLLEFDVSSMRSAAGLTSKLMDFLYIKDLDKAESYLKQAEASGADRTVMAQFKKEIARLRKEAKEGTKDPLPPAPDPGDKPEVKPPSNDPVGDLKRQFETPAAKRMRELEEERQRNVEEERKKKAAKAAEEAAAAAAAAAKKPETPPTSVSPGGTGITDPGGSSGTGSPTGSSGEISGGAGSKPSPAGGASKPAPTEPAPAKSGGGLPLWNLILMGVAGVLLVVTVITKLTHKKKEGAGGE